MMKIKSLLLVCIQFSCIFLLLSMTNSSDRNIASNILSGLGLLVGIIGIWEMKKSKLSIIPDVAKNAILVKSGIYGYIRHPMYTGVLLFCLGLLLSKIQLQTAIVYCVLVFDLLIKLHFEEKLLQKHFPTYRQYMNKTKRLIPMIY